LRRADRPAGPGPLDQGPAAGARRRGADIGPVARRAPRPDAVRRPAPRDGARVAAIGEPLVKADGDRLLRESYRFCGSLSRREVRNFYYAFLLLPSGRRRSMCALYAFLRHTDDLADEPGPAEQKAEALESWRHALDVALAGDPGARPGLPALADTVARHALPPHLLHEAIEGVSMDIQPRGFAAFDELADYCYHVASVVGLCCLHIWGYRSEGGEAERLAEHCGIALQLTNILRDVREDALSGRIYLPRDDLTRFGVAPEDLSSAGRPGDRVRA